MLKRVVPLVLATLMLASCASSSESTHKEIVPPSQMPLGPNDITTTAEAPKIPSITQAPITSIRVDDNSELSAASNAKPQVKDDWFIQQVRASGVDSSKTRLYDIRETVCNLLEQQVPVSNISRSFPDYDFTEEQLGVIIGTSMISACPDYSAIIKESDLPENNS